MGVFKCPETGNPCYSCSHESECKIARAKAEALDHPRRLHRPPTFAEMCAAIGRAEAQLNRASALVDPNYTFRIDLSDMALYVGTINGDLVALPPGASAEDLLMWCYGAGFGLIVGAPADLTAQVSDILMPIISGGLAH